MPHERSSAAAPACPAVVRSTRSADASAGPACMGVHTAGARGRASGGAAAPVVRPREGLDARAAQRARGRWARRNGRRSWACLAPHPGRGRWRDHVGRVGHCGPVEGRHPTCGPGAPRKCEPCRSAWLRRCSRPARGLPSLAVLHAAARNALRRRTRVGRLPLRSSRRRGCARGTTSALRSRTLRDRDAAVPGTDRTPRRMSGGECSATGGLGHLRG